MGLTMMAGGSIGFGRVDVISGLCIIGHQPSGSCHHVDKLQ